MAGLSIALTRCVSPSFAALAKAAHSLSLKLGPLSNLHLATRIVAAYCKCGMVDGACQLFDEISTTASFLDVVSWNTVVTGCVQKGRDKDAFRYFNLMQSYYSLYRCDDEAFGADSYTLSSLLSSTHCLEKNMSIGKQLHGYAIRTGTVSGLSVSNALITFYATWDRLWDAKQVFDTMPQRNVVSWTASISGFARRRGYEEESLRLFVQMMRGDTGQKPNQFTFASVFSACASIAWYSQGTVMISLAIKLGHFFNIHVQNSLIGFYSECGCLESAVSAFDALNEPDIVSWNSLLKGHSQQGRGEEALRVLDKMCKKGTAPDSITFLSILSACSHAGLTSQGLDLFSRMERDYGVKPKAEHVSCIVSVLGRAGLVREADAFIRGIGCEVGPSVWRTLLGACRVHRNVGVAELAATELLQLEPCDSEAHVVLSHIYAENGRWDMVRNLRHSMKEKGVEKEEPGFSWIDVGNRVHSFVAADSGHPDIYEIEERLIELTNNIKDEAAMS